MLEKLVSQAMAAADGSRYSAADFLPGFDSSLPHRSRDPIMRLTVHYFEQSDYFRSSFFKLDDLSQSDRGLSWNKIAIRRYYLMSWLSALYVVIEGFEGLPIVSELNNRPLDIPAIADAVPLIIDAFATHRNSLRLLRNGQYHFQKTAEKHIQFFDDKGKIAWASEIHRAVDKILREYRIRAAVVCAMANRRDEIQMRSPRKHPLGKVRLVD